MTRHQVWKARERARFLFIATQARLRRVPRGSVEKYRLLALGNQYAGEVSALTYRMRKMDEAAGRPVKWSKRMDPYGVFTG